LAEATERWNEVCSYLVGQGKNSKSQKSLSAKVESPARDP